MPEPFCRLVCWISHGKIRLAWAHFGKGRLTQIRFVVCLAAGALAGSASFWSIYNFLIVSLYSLLDFPHAIIRLDWPGTLRRGIWPSIAVISGLCVSCLSLCTSRSHVNSSDSDGEECIFKACVYFLNGTPVSHFMSKSPAHINTNLIQHSTIAENLHYWERIQRPMSTKKPSKGHHNWHFHELKLCIRSRFAVLWWTSPMIRWREMKSESWLVISIDSHRPL